MNKIKDILFGIIDGILPGIGTSIKKTNDGQIEVNKFRLISALCSWALAIGVITGKITIETAIMFIKAFIN